MRLIDIVPTRMTTGGLDAAGQEILEVLSFAGSKDLREQKIDEIYNDTLYSDVQTVSLASLGMLQSLGFYLPLSCYNAYTKDGKQDTVLLDSLYNAAVLYKEYPTAMYAIRLFNIHQALRFLDSLKAFRRAMFALTWESLYFPRSEYAQNIIEDYVDTYKPRVTHPSFEVNGQPRMHFVQWRITKE